MHFVMDALTPLKDLRLHEAINETFEQLEQLKKAPGKTEADWLSKVDESGAEWKWPGNKGHTLLASSAGLEKDREAVDAAREQYIDAVLNITDKNI